MVVVKPGLSVDWKPPGKMKLQVNKEAWYLFEAPQGIWPSLDEEVFGSMAFSLTAHWLHCQKAGEPLTLFHQPTWELATINHPDTASQQNIPTQGKTITTALSFLRARIPNKKQKQKPHSLKTAKAQGRDQKS